MIFSGTGKLLHIQQYIHCLRPPHENLLAPNDQSMLRVCGTRNSILFTLEPETSTIVSYNVVYYTYYTTPDRTIPYPKSLNLKPLNTLPYKQRFRAQGFWLSPSSLAAATLWWLRGASAAPMVSGLGRYSELGRL